MRITYDAEANAAYLYLVEIADKSVKRTRTLSGQDIMLDFDAADRLLGIEILNARARLPQEVIAAATPDVMTPSSLVGDPNMSEEQAIARVRTLFPKAVADQDQYGWYVRAIDANGRLYGFLGRASTGPEAWVQAAQLLEKFKYHDLLSEKSPAR